MLVVTTYFEEGSLFLHECDLVFLVVGEVLEVIEFHEEELVLFSEAFIFTTVLLDSVLEVLILGFEKLAQLELGGEFVSRSRNVLG